MPYGDDYDLPSEWYEAEKELFDDLVGGRADIGGDGYLQALFDAAMFDDSYAWNERQAVYDALIDYLQDEYGIYFEDVFDWEDYREWYDSQ